MTAIWNGRTRPKSRADDSMIKARDHRDDVDQSIALDGVLLGDANLLQLHTS